MKYLLGLSLLCNLFFHQVFALDLQHDQYNKVIGPHVQYNLNQTASKIDYSKIKLKDLKIYTNSLLSLSKGEFNDLNRNDQLAFLINTYNALTIQLILERKPEKSIKEIGSLFSSTWKQKFFKIFGKESHLDHIEHELTRESGKYNDPRIHFAFNCASIGCPALKKTPFIGKKIEEQLEASTKMFLSDRNRNYFKDGKLFVSKIFDWYEGDFKKGHRGSHSLKDFFSRYAESLTDDPKTLDLIKKKEKYEIEFLDYDWKLNNQF